MDEKILYQYQTDFLLTMYFSFTFFKYLRFIT